MADSKNTVELFNQLNSVKSTIDFNQYFETIKENRITFSQYYNDILAEKNITLADARKQSGLSKDYAYGIINGHSKNPSKNKVLALCVAAHMTIDETNKALRLTNNSCLDVRNVRDACIVFYINKGIYDVIKINQFIESQNGSQKDMLV